VTPTPTPVSELPDWARRLDLQPHPEGGWFRETWRSELSLPAAVLPPGYAGERSAGTAILFLLMPGQQSAWHTVRGAELWFHHRGSPVVLEAGSSRDTATTQLLGPDLSAGQHPQLIVPPGHWQRARPQAPEPALVSCVVVPGFEFADFALEASAD
jgi:predicted cupin superfamily sugar epimerase